MMGGLGVIVVRKGRVQGAKETDRTQINGRRVDDGLPGAAHLGGRTQRAAQPVIIGSVP